MTQITETMNDLVNEVKKYNLQKQEEKKQNTFSFAQEHMNLSIMLSEYDKTQLKEQRDLVLLYFRHQKIEKGTSFQDADFEKIETLLKSLKFKEELFDIEKELSDFNLFVIFNQYPLEEQNKAFQKIASWLNFIKEQEGKINTPNALIAYEKATDFFLDFLAKHWHVEQSKFDANVGRLMNRHANASLKRALLEKPLENDYTIDEAKAILKRLPDLFESPRELFTKKLDAENLNSDDVITSIDNWLAKFKGDVVRVKTIPCDISSFSSKIEKIETSLNNVINTDNELIETLLESHHQEKFRRDCRDFKIKSLFSVLKGLEDSPYTHLFNALKLTCYSVGIWAILLSLFGVSDSLIVLVLSLLVALLIAIMFSPVSLYFSTKGKLLKSPLKDDELYSVLKNKFNLPEYDVFCRRCKTTTPEIIDVLYCLMLRTRQEKN